MRHRALSVKEDERQDMRFLSVVIVDATTWSLHPVSSHIKTRGGNAKSRLAVSTPSSPRDMAIRNRISNKNGGAIIANLNQISTLQIP
jgi:hypothetical protein